MTTNDVLPPSGDKPKSAVPELAALVSLGAFVIAAMLTKYLRIDSPVVAFLMLSVAIVAMNLTLSERMIRRDAQKEAGRSERLFVKICAISTIFIIVFVSYKILPHYESEKYQLVIENAQNILIAVLVVAPVYIAFTDARMNDPYDGLYMLGCLIIGRSDRANRAAAKQYALGWLVKAFFLPVMAAFALEDLRWWLAVDLASNLDATRGWFGISYRFLFFVDVVWATLGYLFTLRLFNCQIRSTDATLKGWLVCIVCYPPFWGVMYDNYLNYEDGYYWGDFFAVGSVGGTIWGAAILACVVIYVWATASFGLRFSNLTNRGIITSGPYRYTKHPAYISKNISWWMISIPFISSQGHVVALNMCLLLLLVNFLYYLRARTEEDHLQSDPTYVAYREWIERNGLWAKGKRLLSRSA